LRVFGQTDQQIYTDGLQNGWQDWGWATLNYNNTSPVHSGTKSIAVTIADNSYQAIYIAHNAFDSTPTPAFPFGLTAGRRVVKQLQIQAILGTAAQTTVKLPLLPTNSWQKINVSLVSLGVAAQPNFPDFGFRTG
jgi:hypothetical protein